MMFLFPFEKIEKGSRVILYGMGNVGKSFYSQLKKTNYCEIVGWTDSHMGRDAQPNGLLISVEQIKDLDYDHVMIAISKEETAKEIADTLLVHGVDPSKIVWEKCTVPQYGWPKDLTQFRQDSDFYLKILELFSETESFSNYQSLPRAGLSGGRPTGERIETYQLREILTRDQDVLDIGCNCGFFDLQIADDVKSILGVEYEHNLVEVANATKEHLNIKNCTFVETDFNNWIPSRTFDVIFAFAVLHWVGLEPDQMAERLKSLLSPSGYILMESHGTTAKDLLLDFERCVGELVKRGLQIVRRGNIFDAIPRKYVIMKG